MRDVRKLVATVVIAAAATLATGTASAFWGPFDWWDDGPGWGGPWGGYPGYGYGYPGYWGGYPGYGYGYPGYGWGGYPGYGYGYPGYGAPYAVPPAAPAAPAKKSDQ